MNHIYDEGGLPGERSRYKNCPEDCNLGCPECLPEEEEEIRPIIEASRKLNLDDDTSWPDPRFIRDAAWKLIYNPDQLTEHDRATLFSCVDAYFHLLTHPWGTDASIRKIRMLRRAIRLNEKDKK